MTTREGTTQREAPADVTGGLLDSGHPRLEKGDAQAILAHRYGVEGVLRRFSSERDDTFGVDGADGRYVLKISHPLERPEEVAFQLQLLDAVAARDPELPVPSVVRDLAGGTHHTHLDPRGAARIVRLLTFLDGQPLQDVVTDRAERRAIGRMLARLRLATQGFAHPAESRFVAWDVRHLERLRPLLEGHDGEHGDLLTRALDRVGALMPVIDTLRRQVLHNDFNKPNLVVTRGTPDFVTGVIDFGDAVRTALAIDVSTALQDHLPADPEAYAGDVVFDDAADVLRGYLDVADLTPTELRIVPHLIMGRVVAIGLITTARAQLVPENAAYILRTTDLVWPQLSWFLDREVDQVSELFVARVDEGG